MPAKPLTAEQKADAERLRNVFARRKMEAPELTQEALAHDCGWKTQGAVNQYFNAKIPLNVPALAKFAKALNVSPDEISPALAMEMRRFVAVVHPDAEASKASNADFSQTSQARSSPDRIDRQGKVVIVTPPPPPRSYEVDGREIQEMIAIYMTVNRSKRAQIMASLRGVREAAMRDGSIAGEAATSDQAELGPK